MGSLAQVVEQSTEDAEKEYSRDSDACYRPEVMGEAGGVTAVEICDDVLVVRTLMSLKRLWHGGCRNRGSRSRRLCGPHLRPWNS